jgi:hypothetical protein
LSKESADVVVAVRNSDDDASISASSECPSGYRREATKKVMLGLHRPNYDFTPSPYPVAYFSKYNTECGSTPPDVGRSKDRVQPLGVHANLFAAVLFDLGPRSFVKDMPEM